MTPDKESVVNVENGLGSVEVGFDSDKDGKSSVAVELNYVEGASELFGKLQGKEISFNGKARLDENGVAVFGIDLDGDGEESVKFKLDVKEAIDEGTQAIKK